MKIAYWEKSSIRRSFFRGEGTKKNKKCLPPRKIRTSEDRLIKGLGNDKWKFQGKKSRRVSIVFMFSIDFPSNYKHVHQLAIWSRMFEGTQWPIAEGRGLQAERGVVTPWVFNGDWCCKSTLLAFEHFIESGKLKANLDAELLRSRGRLDERESDFKLNHPNSPNCFSNISYKATWKNMGLDQDMFKTVKFDHGEIDCYWNKDWLSHSVLDGVLQAGLF